MAISKSNAAGKKGQMITIEQTFREIAVQYVGGSTSTSDDWTANNQ